VRSLLLTLALLLPGLAAAEGRPLAGGGVSAADAAEIRAVIHRQIEAFRRDDARGAFALASPGVQEAFGADAERFLDVVRTSYRAVYRPSAIAFLDLTVLGVGAVQQVQLTDSAGTLWLAYYAMQRQRDGSWRTSGCHLAPPGRTISAAWRP
jgi:hypothetical protein